MTKKEEVMVIEKIITGLKGFCRKTDVIYWVLTLTASIYGCALIASQQRAGEVNFLRTQIIAIVIGYAAAIIIAWVDYRLIAKCWWVFAGIALALTMGITLAGCGGSDDSSDVEETTQVTEETTAKATEATEAMEADEDEGDTSFAEFKKTMDDYEDFFDSYCELMKEYNKNPNSVMDEYLEMNQKYLTVMEELDAIDEDELTDEEEAYYLEVMARINSKLLEVAN